MATKTAMKQALLSKSVSLREEGLSCREIQDALERKVSHTIIHTWVREIEVKLPQGVITVKQAARRLRCGQSRVYGLIQAGKIPSQKAPSGLRYQLMVKKDGFEDYLRSLPIRRCLACGHRLARGATKTRVTCSDKCSREHYKNHSSSRHVRPYSLANCPGWARPLLLDAQAGLRDEDILIELREAITILHLTKAAFYYWVTKGLLTAVPTKKKANNGRRHCYYIRRQVETLAAARAKANHPSPSPDPSGLHF